MKTDIKPLNAIWRLFIGKPSLGESYNLKKLIQSQFSREEYNRLQSICKTYDFEIGVGVTNMEDAQFEMIKIRVEIYDEFINYMWASANQPVFMTYYYDEKRKRHFADGGLIEVLPIRQAIDYAVKHKVDTIDVVLNSSINNIEPKDFSIRTELHFWRTHAHLEHLMDNPLCHPTVELGMLKATMESIVRDDYSEGLDRDIVINIYSMNRKLSQLDKDELGFDKDLMKFLLAYGYHSTHRILEPPALALTQQITNLHASPSPVVSRQVEVYDE
jgi:predicted acylesterase/phospholipase RssA